MIEIDNISALLVRNLYGLWIKLRVYSHLEFIIWRLPYRSTWYHFFSNSQLYFDYTSVPVGWSWFINIKNQVEVPLQK